MVAGHRAGAMAVVNTNSSVLFDNDDDDGPISFKRSSNSVKSSRPTPSKQEGSSGGAGTPVRSQKHVAPNQHKNGVSPGVSRPMHMKAPSPSPNHRPSGSGQPNSSAAHGSKSNSIDKSKLKRPLVKEENSDDSDDDVPIGLRKKVEEKKLKRVDEKADDSDDDKPLSHKINSSKMSSNSTSRPVLQKAVAKVEQPDEDSDDDKPLASRLPTNAAPKSGGNASEDSEDEKPLAARFSKVSGSGNPKLASSSKGLNNESGGTRNLGKRPLDNSNQTSLALKKAKPSNVSASASVKREIKADDNDNTPLAQRLKIGESSKGKPSAKNAVKKSPASMKKGIKKMKGKVKTKKMKNSQFSKTMKVPPGSGGGKKWTTLEHNGVIFPPPYKPHGVKMLYNGKPVDLTPEQEEVIYQ